MTAATPILYYTPQSGSTWTNLGSAGSAYNATCSTPGKYAVGSNGHPYWGCYQDYICIPSGAAVDSTRYASFEIGIYYEARDSGQQFQKLWDKAWGAFDIYIDTRWDCLTIMRATAPGGHNYYWTTDAGNHTRQFVPGHYYYIQVNWNEGTSPANFGGVSLRVGVDGNAPVDWSLVEDSQSPTGGWMSHAGYSANLCNTSSGGACPASANVAWQHGRLYVFRQYNTLVNFNTDGHWDTDKYLWLTGLPNSTIRYDEGALSAASGNSITSNGSQSTVATAYNSSKTTVGAHTAWSLPGGSSYITIPATSNYASEPNLAFDIDVYIPTQDSGVNGAIIQRIADNGYQSSVFLDTTNNRLLVTRGTTTPNQDSWTTPNNSITYNTWWNIQVVWNVGAHPAGAPTVYLTPPGHATHQAMTMAHAASGSGSWAAESSNRLYVGNASPYDAGPELKIGYLCWYNYAPDEPSLNTRYASFSNEWYVTVIPTVTTVTVSNAHPVEGATFTVSGSVKTGATPGTAVTGVPVFLVSDDGNENYVLLGSPPTNASGNFTLNTSIGEVGTYTITASIGDVTMPNGTKYSASSDTINVTVGAATTSTTLSISTTNSYPSQNTGFTISGVLHDVSSNPLQGKTVTLAITDTYNTKTTYGTTTTNAGGTYSFANISKSIEGTYVIEAKFVGDAQYSPISNTLNVIVVLSGTLQSRLTLTISNENPALTEGYTVSGKLTDGSDNPIPNATVSIVVEDAMPTPEQTQTGVDGSYSFDELGEGNEGVVQIIVSYNGNASYSGCEAVGYVTFSPETNQDSTIILAPIIKCVPTIILNTSINLVGIETQDAIDTFHPHFCKTIRLNPTITATTDKLDGSGKTKKLVFKGADIVLNGGERASFTSRVSQRSVAELSVTEWRPAPVFQVNKTLHLVVTIGRSINTYVNEDIILPIGDGDLVTGSYEMDLTPIQEVEKLHVRGRAYEHSTAAPHNYRITIPQEPIVIHTAETAKYNANINFTFQTDGNFVVVSADANLTFLPPATAHKAVDYILEVRKKNEKTSSYDLLGVIDGKIAPALTQELGMADVLSFNLQLTDQKTLIATDFKRGNEIWYYGQDARLKQVFIIQRVDFYRDYGASGLSSGGATLGAGSGDNVFISAGGPEVYLTWYYFENDYTAIQKKPTDILADLCKEVVADGVVRTWWVDPTLNVPIDLSLSWENLKTACDSITKQTGGFAKVVIDPVDPTYRTLELLPSGSTPGTYYPTSQYWFPAARRYGDKRRISVTSTDLPVVVFDTFPKLGNEIQNDGGNGLLDCDGFMNCNNVFTMKNGATAEGFYWGDDCITIKSCPQLLNLYSVSVEMCVRINNTANDGCLFSKGESGSSAFSMVYDHAYKRIVVSRGTTGGNIDSWATLDNSVPPEDWYYIQLLWAAGVQPDPNNPPQIIIDNVIMNVTHHSVGTGYWHGDLYYDLYIGNDNLGGSALDGAVSLFRLYSYVIDTYIDNFLHDGWRREAADAPVDYDMFPVPFSSMG